MTSRVPHLDRLVAKASQLYSLPAVAMQVLELTNHPQLDTQALKACIENDPALTGKLLRVVNSSLFGLSREVTDLNQALALLGTKPLKLLILGFSLPPGLFDGVEDATLAHYWRHTLTRAVAAREIGQTWFDVSGDEAFIAGLLQDLGLLLLIQELGEPYTKLVERVRGNGTDTAADGDSERCGGRDLATLEVDALGFDHQTLSARLLADWGLPTALVEAVAQRPVGDATDADGSNTYTLLRKQLPQILHLAELVACLLADRRSDVLPELLYACREYRGVSRAEFNTLVTSLSGKVAQLADVLSLQISDDCDHRDFLAKMHQRLAAVATEAAGELFRAKQRERIDTKDDALLAELERLAEAVASTAPLPTIPRPPRLATKTDSGRLPTMTTINRETTTAILDTTVGLVERLATAVAACRRSRCPLSLLLVEHDGAIDHQTENSAILGHQLDVACRVLAPPYTVRVAYGAAGRALILPDCERQTAVQYGNQLIAEIGRLMTDGGQDIVPGIGLGIGVATVSLPPKNFPAKELLAGADRCLYGSLASGGVVKSIEIY